MTNSFSLIIYKINNIFHPAMSSGNAENILSLFTYTIFLKYWVIYKIYMFLAII